MSINTPEARALLCGCALVALAAPGAAYAQAAASSSSNVQEVVVTAQRRQELLENVPMAITAISGDVAEKAGIVSMRDISQVAPGVRFESAGVYSQAAIRGVSSLSGGDGYENNVAIYIDGFYMPGLVSINTDLGNIAGIEVLKGPQGALWGRNATGGAILVTTKRPSSTLTGAFEVGYGRFDDKMAKAYVAGPITDWLRFSVAGYARKGDGYIKRLDAAGNRIGNMVPVEQYSARVKLEADVTKDFRATLGLNYSETDDGRGLLFTYRDHEAPSIGPKPPRADGLYEASGDFPHKVQGIVREATVKLEYDTPIGMLTSYTGFTYMPHRYVFEFDGSWATSSSDTDRAKIEQAFQQTIDYNIDVFDRWNIVVGAQYFKDRWKQINGRAFRFGQVTQVANHSIFTEAVAAYGDATFKATDKLSLNFGARYTDEKKGFWWKIVNGAGVDLQQPGSIGDKAHNLSLKGSVRYEIAERTNVYASYSEGYRSGGFNTSPPPTLNLWPLFFFKPEKIKAYEVGLKGASPRMRYDLAAFYYDYSNLQVSTTVPNPLLAGGFLNVVRNAQKAEIYGLDASVQYEVIENLNVRASASWLHARYKKAPGVNGNGFDARTGLNVSQVQDWSGQQMARAPDFSATLGADYTIDDVLGGSLLFSGNLFYSSSLVVREPSLFGPLAPAALRNKQRYRQDGYHVLNAQVRWTDPTDRYTVTVWGTNLTNQEYRISYGGSSFGDHAVYAEPISYGVRLGYSF